MAILKSLLSASLLGLSLVSAAAFAGPVYHVKVDTGAFSGKGILELILTSPLTAGASSASLSTFTGKFTHNVDAWGSPTGTLESSVGLNAPFEAGLWEGIELGGVFGFDVSFDGPAGGADHAAFTVALLQDHDDTMLGDEEYLVLPAAQFDLGPQAEPVFTGSAYAELAPDAAVPEPATMLSMLTGLGLLGLSLRRRA